MENKEAATIEQNLRLLRQLKPDPYWQDGVRSALLKKTPSVTWFSWFLHFRWQVSAALVLLIVFLTGGTAVLAQGSVPGDLLYPVKRNLEDFRLVFASSEGKFVIQQELADRRIAELKRIVLARRYQVADPAIKEIENSISIISQKAQVMSTQYQVLKQEGRDDTPIKETLEKLVPVIEQKRAELAQIEETLPETARPKLDAIRQSLDDLGNQVRVSLESMPEPVEEQPSVEGIETQGTTPSTSGKERPQNTP